MGMCFEEFNGHKSSLNIQHKTNHKSCSGKKEQKVHFICKNPL